MKFFVLFLLVWDGETWRTMSRQEILERARGMCEIAWSPCDTQDEGGNAFHVNF